MKQKCHPQLLSAPNAALAPRPAKMRHAFAQQQATPQDREKPGAHEELFPEILRYHLLRKWWLGVGKPPGSSEKVGKKENNARQHFEAH